MSHIWHMKIIKKTFYIYYMDKFKFGVICPDRGDRVLMLEQFHRLMDSQTIKPDILELVTYVPESDAIDISQRYRLGYDKLRNQGLDCILFIESDDWYSPNYIETMLRGWVDHGCPDMFGTNYTTYVNLRLGEGVVRKALTLHHAERSSMMSTLIKADLDLQWPDDSYPYTDSHLWIHCKNRKTFAPENGWICLGLKGGYVKGLSGGSFHNDKLKMFTENVHFLKVVGEDNFKFYSENFPLLKTRLEGRDLVFVE